MLKKINRKIAAVIAAALALCLIIGVTASYADTWYGAYKSTSANSSKKMRTYVTITVSYPSASTASVYVECGITSNYGGDATVSGCHYSYTVSGACSASGSSGNYQYHTNGSNNNKKVFSYTYSVARTSANQTVSASIWGYGNGGNNWGSSSNKSTASGSATIAAAPYYTLDVNGSRNGVSQGNTSPMGTFDVYHNGSLVANDVTDWYSTTMLYGYTINDIRANDGYKYTGNASYTGSSAATVVLPFQAMVRYNSNTKGPGGNSSTDAELISPHGSDYFVNQDGRVLKGGSDAYTAGTTYNLIDLDDENGLNLGKAGYHIEPGREWNTSSDGTGTDYDQAASYAASVFSSPVTLYANWKPNEYSITYLPNGADTGVMPQQIIRFDERTSAISGSYIKDGFRLRGWDRNSDADPTGPLDIVGDKGVISNSMLESFGNGDTIELYAIWRPISESATEIYAGKVVNEDSSNGAETDAYTFRIEPVEGEQTDNESTHESGHSVSADDMPLPEGTPEGQRYKDIEVTGLAGNPRMLRTQGFDVIEFEEPGWYIYKVSEIPGDDSRVSYDKNYYFVACYVQYKEETGWKVVVSNTTAWHNRNGLENYRPNTSDISSKTDNGGNPATDNDGNPLTATESRNFGKKAIGHQSVVVAFYNTESPSFDPDPPMPSTADLYITKNVKGGLGDRSKEFEYTAEISGLAANATYALENVGADLGYGFIGRPGNQSIPTDANGVAYIEFRMSDDDNIYIPDLPVGATFNISESGSNHIPSFIVYTGQGVVKEAHALYGHSVATGDVSMTEGGEVYIARFDNFRDIAVNTGVLARGLPVGAILIIAVGIALTVFVRRRHRNVISDENE